MGGASKDPVQSTVSSMLCSPDCCFIGVEFGSLSSIFHWASTGTTGTMEEDELIMDEPKDRDYKQHPTKKHRQHRQYQQERQYWKKNQTKRSDEHPPSVIALSRSSYSNSSRSTTSSNFGLTDDGDDQSSCDGIEQNNSGFNAITAALSKSMSIESYCPDEEMDVVPLLNSEYSASCQDQHDYTNQHELLLSSLFADAQARIALKEDNENANTSPIQMSTPDTTSTTRKSLSNLSPKSRRDSVSEYSKRSATARSIGTSRYSGSSRSSGLHPSAHRFRRKLKGKTRRKARVLPLRSNKKGNTKRTTTTISSSRRGYSVVTPPRNKRNITINSHNMDDYSSIASSHNTPGGPNLTNTAAQFLQGNCNLQKDEGKGERIGGHIVAHGRDFAMQKLTEKMDRLAELEREGGWSNAVLSRVPAKVFPMRGPNQRKRYIETRSMLSLRVGFFSMKYGLLVHWNAQTGLAELILLRKKCSDSFMIPHTKKSKRSKVTYERRRSLRRSRI